MTAKESKEPEHVEVEKWRFVDRAPSQAEVVDLIKSLPETYGVRPIDYIDYVQAIPQSENRKKKVGGRTVDDWHDTWSLYFSVAGRIKMLEEAARVNSWVVEFIPEPATMTGRIPALQTGDRIAYRVVLKITTVDGKLVGTRTGMSAKGGGNAWEKAETGANGRAIAAFGIGVLPGSGIASLEEMQSAESDTQTRRKGNGPGVVNGSEEDDTDHLATLRTNVVKLQQLRGIPWEEQAESIVKYLVSKFRYDKAAVINDKWELNWDQVRPTHRQMVNNMVVALIKDAQRADAAL
jgi:hypothetical protein